MGLGGRDSKQGLQNRSWLPWKENAWTLLAREMMIVKCKLSDLEKKNPLTFKSSYVLPSVLSLNVRITVGKERL